MARRGFDKRRLDRVREVLARYVEHSDIPGVVALAGRDGETHVETAGVAATGGSRPMQRDSIFRIASMTKPITAVAALILVEECVVHLDEPVGRLLPELADRRRGLGAGQGAGGHASQGPARPGGGLRGDGRRHGAVALAGAAGPRPHPLRGAAA